MIEINKDEMFKNMQRKNTNDQLLLLQHLYLELMHCYEWMEGNEKYQVVRDYFHERKILNSKFRDIIWEIQTERIAEEINKNIKADKK